MRAIDAEDLLLALRQEAHDPGLEWERPPRRLSGGFFAEIFHVWIKNSEKFDGDFVIRRLPDDRTWELEILAQTEAAKLGFATPRVHLSYVPTDGSGRAWMMMDFAPGRTLVRNADVVEFARSALKDLWKTPTMLAEIMVRLHSLDASSLVDKLGHYHVVGANLSWLYSHAARIGRGGLMLRAEQLMASRPPYRQSVFCHGDLHPINVVRGPEGDCVLDWTYAAYDDPYQDVANTWILLRYVPIDVPAFMRPLVESLGMVLARRFLNQYTALSNVPLDLPRLEWFKRLAVLRVLVDVEEWKAHSIVDEKSGHPYFVFAPILERAYP